VIPKYQQENIAIYTRTAKNISLPHKDVAGPIQLMAMISEWKAEVSIGPTRGLSINYLLAKEMSEWCHS
jgi:hypothetical protein